MNMIDELYDTILKLLEVKSTEKQHTIKGAIHDYFDLVVRESKLAKVKNIDLSEPIK